MFCLARTSPSPDIRARQLLLRNQRSEENDPFLAAVITEGGPNRAIVESEALVRVDNSEVPCKPNTFADDKAAGHLTELDAGSQS